MRGGQVVTYVDATGQVCPAVICGLPGSGPSGVKILDLRMADGSVVERVAHEGDREPGGGYWTLGAVEPEPPPAPSRGRRHWQA
jgi:hypothetical protein